MKELWPQHYDQHINEVGYGVNMDPHLVINFA